MQTTTKFSLSCLLFFSLIFMSGCGGNDPSALVGKWVLESVAVPSGATGTGMRDLELHEDGTAFVNGQRTTWKVVSGRLAFDDGEGARYRVSGSTLTVWLYDPLIRKTTTLTFKKLPN